MNRSLLLIAPALLALTLSVSAQNVAPVVSNPIADLTVYAGTPEVSVDVTNAFSDPDVSDAVRFTTDIGNVDIELLGSQKPVTVANFLKYVDQGRYFIEDPVTHQPASSFVHRSIPGFIIQGGGFLGTVNQSNNGLNPTAILTSDFGPIKNEPGISNKRGTIAMAQDGTNADSATSQWFINLADNGGPPNNLDVRNNNAGPYTVFGRIGNNTMPTVDAIAALPTFNFFSPSVPSSAPFTNLPLENYTSDDYNSAVRPMVANLVSIPGISHIPTLTYASSSDNGNAATATVSGTHVLVTGKSIGTAHVTVTATDMDGASVSQQFTVNVIAGPGRLVNLSTRMQVGTGDNALIAGFIMRGSTPKRLAVRGMGPSTGLPGSLVNPTLELHNSTGTIATNDDWQTEANKQDIIDVGLAPNSPTESVILTTVPSDPSSAAYTAVERGAFDGTGLGVVEVYDLDSNAGSMLLNISTRGQVGADPNALIAGFILGGAESKQILVRAIGPSLTAFGVSNALADPTLELHDMNGALIDSNDNWMTSSQQAQIQSSGLAPTDPKESAVIQTLAAGQYTAVVHGANGGTGVGSVEVYQLP
jgi:cyclophilin family peptidyl-prolyl cis-trans isomerase